MNQLQIILSVNEIEIAKTDFISVEREHQSDVFKIVFGELKIDKELKLKTGDDLSINIQLKGYPYGVFDILLLNELILEPQKMLSVTAQTLLAYYDQRVIDIFKAWDDGMNLDWRDMEEEGREAWLTASLYWSGLPQMISPGEFILDGGLVGTHAGFFCLLGEVFFGKRGYFGQNVDGMKDCLIEAYHSINNVTLILKNFHLLKEILNREIAEYTDHILDDLKRYKIRVVIA